MDAGSGDGKELCNVETVQLLTPLHFEVSLQEGRLFNNKETSLGAGASATKRKMDIWMVIFGLLRRGRATGRLTCSRKAMSESS